MKYELTVFIDTNEETNKSTVSIGFPKEQDNMSTQSAAHLLTAGVALLIKACSKTDTGIKDHELMKEVYQHLELEFSSITSSDDTFVKEDYFKKEKNESKKE